MRKLLFILLAILLLPCCVHQPQNGVRSLLKEVEGMIRTSPDTAYFLLREMETTMDLETEADSAYHGLLLMEAQAKNGIKLTDTTAIGKLAHYYKERQDSLIQIRLLRLRGLAHRDGGHYEEAVKCYNIVIDKAKRIGKKRLLADMYYELANLCYSGFLALHGDEKFETLSDSLFYLTEKTAEQQKDTVLWMKALIAHSNISQSRNEFEVSEQRLLQALNLAITSENKGAEISASLKLSVIYAKMGKKERSLLYAKRNLALRKEGLSDYLYYTNLGNAFRQIGEKDSADFYFKKSKTFKKDAFHANVPISFKDLSGNMKEKATSIDLFLERMQQKKELEYQQTQKNKAYLILIVAIIVAVICSLALIGKSYSLDKELVGLHKASEELRQVLEKEKGKLKAECHSVQAQLLQKDEDLKRQKAELVQNQQKLCEVEELLKQAEETLQKEKGMLLCKESEIRTLQLRLEQFMSDTSRVFDKIKQMVADYRHKDSSDLKMEEQDWELLLLAMDKKENGAVTRIQQEFQLSDMEVRLLCLHLAGVATAQISHFLGVSRNTLYGKNNEMLSKMGIKRTSSTFKKDIQEFLKNRK